MFPFENYLAKTFFTNLITANPYVVRRLCSSFVCLNKGKKIWVVLEDLSKVELGTILGPSCEMWAGNLIPANYIYGGETRINESDPTSRLLSVRTYETLLYVKFLFVYLIDSPYNLVRKIKMVMQNCTYTQLYSVNCPEPTKDEMDDMDTFVNDWLSDFIDFMLDYLDDYKKDETHLLKPLFFTSVYKLK
ncbi:hypothetical protein RFI_33166 [Reticulomyxa filosa]|uniref:Uncharacterized protein n=1 Tax=Reticulomyxa filosa TaxID=46433 RepID=X6LQS2_RETFI|nr:hypothetical protein RFI_33166 [Reticulomyxa filosa]|eukprot:ETO04233.1 hypothetical protein RFI_33166 [Reticulomyxa filosa]